MLHTMWNRFILLYESLLSHTGWSTPSMWQCSAEEKLEPNMLSFSVYYVGTSSCSYVGMSQRNTRWMSTATPTGNEEEESDATAVLKMYFVPASTSCPALFEAPPPPVCRHPRTSL
jgi:hypothetical protein